MRRPTARRTMRTELAWIAAGLVFSQVLLGLAVDQAWPAVRDPEFAMLQRRLAAQRARAPHRPLVLVLGSSRTALGLRAGRLNVTSDETEPLVFNFGLYGAGPMLQEVVLGRLRDQGIRPDLVILEAMPVSMSQRRGTPLEEHHLDAARLDAAEAVRLGRYYRRPDKLLATWIAARALPAYRHQAELHDALLLDAPAAHGGTVEDNSIDAFGWRQRPAPVSPAAREAKLQADLYEYAPALADATPAAGPFHALRDLLALCRRDGLPVALVIPPETAPFRCLAEGGCATLEGPIRAIATEFDVPVYDARNWVADDGFADAHHLDVNGADDYTEQFGRVVLKAELQRLHSARRLAAVLAR